MSDNPDPIQVTITAQIQGLMDGLIDATSGVADSSDSMASSFAALMSSVTASFSQIGTSIKESVMGAAESTTEATEVMKERFIETAEAAKISAGGIGGTFGGIGAIMGGGALVGMMGEFIDKTVEENVALGHLSQESGIGVTKLAGLKEMTEELGMSWETVSKGLVMLASNQVKALDGEKEIADAFASLHISTAQLKADSPEQLFVAVSAAMQKETNSSTRLYAARELMSRGGVDAIPIMVKYGATIGDVADKKGKETGSTDDSVAASLRWVAAMAELSDTLHRLTIPIIENLGDVLMGIKGVADGAFAVLVTGFEGLATIIVSVGEAVGDTSNALSDLMTGNLKAAVEDAKGISRNFVDNWKTGFGDISAAWKRTYDDFTKPAPKAEAPKAQHGSNNGQAADEAKIKGVEQSNAAALEAEDKGAEDALKAQDAAIKQQVALAVEGGASKAQAELAALPKYIAAQQAYTQAKLAAIDKNHAAQLKANADEKALLEAGNSGGKNDAKLQENANQRAAIEAKYQTEKASIVSAGKVAVMQLVTEESAERTQIASKGAADRLAVLEQESKQKEAAIKAATSSAIDDAKKEEQAKTKLVDDELSHDLITRQAALTQKLAILQSENEAVQAAYAAQKNQIQQLITAYQAQKATLSETDPEYKKIVGDIAQLSSQYAGADHAAVKFASDIRSTSTQIQQAAAMQTVSWTQFFQKFATESKQATDTLRTGLQSCVTEMNSGVANAFSKSIVEGKSFGQAMRQVTGQILEGFISMCVKMALQWAESHLMMAILAKTTQATSAMGQVASNAAVAGAAGVASFAAAPWPIDMGAPGFGASMFASAMAYGGMASAAGGWDNVPSDQLAQIHKQEMVMSAPLATGLRNLIANGGGNGSSGGGDTHVHLHGQVIDGAFWQKHQGAIVSTVQDAVKNRRS